MNLRLIASLSVVAATSAAAQRQVDLTGKPEAAIRDAFTIVSGVRELPGGKAIVVDQGEWSVFAADFGGGSITKIGRQGDGPNEYRFPLAPMRGLGDTTWIVDATARRAIVLSGTTIVSTVAMPSGGVTGGLISPHGMDREGRAYFEGNGFDSERGSFMDTVAIVRWNPRDNRAEQIARISNGGRVMVNRGGMQSSMARGVTPFPALDAWVPLPQGDVLIVRHTPFRIDRVAADGALRAGTPIAYTAIPVTAEERDAVRRRDESRRITASARGGGGSSFRMPPFPDEAFPKEMPPFIASNVLATPEGEIWVGRSHRVGDAKWRYDIFDASGTLTGSATLGSHARVVGFGAGVVYVARTDPADDLVYLEKFKR